MILRRPPQDAHSLRSEENTRASRVAHRSRWPQDAALAEPSAADGSATGLAGTMRSRARGCQDPVVAQEMKPGRGNQSRQRLHQVHRREQEMAGTIRPRQIRWATLAGLVLIVAGLLYQQKGARAHSTSP